jgi:phosphomannomutase
MIMVGGGAVTIEAGLRAKAEAWIGDDPDERDRAELRGLLDSGAEAELADRFAGRLTFGTAGLRSAVGAGPNRMNRAVVRAATAAVAGWLTGQGGSPSVVVGCDARHRSDEFADEVAAVLAGAGVRVHLLPRPGPTPLLAFAVRHLAVGAGIMITASHNPPADNGYKLYLSDGAQVIPPVDADIEGRIASLGPLSAIPIAALDDPLIVRHGDEVATAYLSAVTARPGPPPAAAAAAQATAAQAGPADLTVVYTPMHGVAGDLMLRAIAQAGFGRPQVVKAQADPDPDFPTVAFPNPEEPGALDLALADARALGADLVLASDPDGDRLAVAVPAPDRPGGASGAPGWRVLTGDQLGALLGAHLLGAVRAGASTASGPLPLVATTIVSSTLLSRIASAAGARYQETLTGFKWISRAADGQPDATFVFGYEEALGYEVGTIVKDKDGIGAALAVLRLAVAVKTRGGTLAGAYDDLERAHGVHLTGQLSLRIPAPAEVMRRIRDTPPVTLGGLPVAAVTDFTDAGTGLPPSDVLSYTLSDSDPDARGARVVIRPSGTEPKIKAYLEITGPPGDDLGTARAAAENRMAPLRASVTALLTS